MRTTASKRQSSLELAQAVSRLLEGVQLGEVALDEVRRLAGQALQGGGVQRRFQELEIPAAPFTSTTAEGDDSAVVRGVTALLGQLKYVNIYSLQPPGGCGACPLVLGSPHIAEFYMIFISKLLHPAPLMNSPSSSTCSHLLHLLIWTFQAAS